MQAVKPLIGLLVGVALALSFLAARYVGKRTQFDDASALGAHTASVFASSGGYPIHCQPGSELENCLKGIYLRKMGTHIVWFGNSQLHAINEYQNGELNAPALLASRLAKRGIDLVTFSQGNANLQEHYVMFEFLRSRVDVKQLILSVVFDDLREDGFRDDVATLLRDQRVSSVLSQSDFGRRLLQKPGSGEVKAETPQDYVESRLNDMLDKHLPLWRARPEMRGDIFIGLYRLRNTVFGITPNTKRKMIPGRYAENIAALNALLQSASKAGIEVLMYIAPVGIDKGEKPYVESEYRRFKEEARDMAARYGARFANLEDSIPERLWGHKDTTTVSASAEVDFMHFTSAGHVVLTDLLENLLQHGARVGRQIRP